MNSLNVSSSSLSIITSWGLFFIQVEALFKKNLLNYWRNKNELLKELMLPLVTAFCIYTNQFTEELAISIQILFPVSLLGHIRSFMIDIIHEKAEKYREYLKINGVGNFAYISSLLLFGYFKCLIFTLITCSGFLFINRENTPFSTIMMFLLYLLTSIACTHFALLITVFFTSKQLCSEIGGFIFTLVSFLFMIVLENQSVIWYYISLIFPQNALAYALFSKNAINFEINFSTLASFMCLDMIVYLLIFVYFDQAFPSTFGVKRNWLFCLQRNSQRRTQQNSNLLNEQRSLIDDEQIGNQRSIYSSEFNLNGEDGSSALYHENFENSSQLRRTVFLENISKSFGSEKVIDNLSLMMYEKQVFCLLGHNGAGKTTTINLLTGIFHHDSGEIYYGGTPFEKSIFSQRKRMGLCNQQDILYPNLTVYEHLRLMGKLRGRTDPELHREIAETLQKTGLVSEKHKLIKTLSGGTKRKLSLGLAVLGDVSIVFLDEPTSGMDPDTRRTVWDLIKELKNEGKTILLTTHHLDEADELSDRLGVMTKGKLFAVGTSEFIKKKFGVGYHLIVTPNYEQNCTVEDFENLKETVAHIITQHIEGAKIDEQGGSSILRFSLPFSDQRVFSQIFEDLEKLVKLKLNLRMNSLEDAFINIGLRDELLIGEELNNETNQVNINIELPRLIKTHIPKYNFWYQLEAMFLRKYFFTIRNYKNFVLIILPIIFVIFGTMTTVWRLRPFETEGFDGTGKSDNAETKETRTQLIETIIIVLFLFFVNFAYSLNATIYCVFPVYEREYKISYSLKVMGCRDVPYWLGTFLFDFLAVQFVNAILVLLVFLFKIEYLQDHLLIFAFTLITFSSAIVTISYLCGFLFQSSNTVFKSYAAFYLFILYVLPTVILAFASHLNIPKFLSTLIAVVVFHLSPNFAFNDSVRLSLGQPASFLTSQMQCALWLLWLTICYISLTVYVHKRKSKVNIRTTRALQDTNFEYEEGVDVSEMTAEINRLNNAQNNDPIRILHLNKVYPNGARAVKDLSFGIQQGEIFGLLGPNGAGKSTTFHISTAMISRSAGNIELKGQSIDSNLDKIFQDEGVCPQFDALWEDLKVLEHLYIYALIKGIALFDQEETVNFLLDAVRLKDYKRKKAKELSGGSRRKLNTSISLIGAPILKFLDEPSTGIDPMSKRFIWECLRKFAAIRNGSLLLTTHSMEEAEALCHRIGIIVNGKFVCLGPLQYLKDKYGSGYKITLVKRPTGENLEEFIQEIFPDAEKVEDSSSTKETYQIKHQSFKFSQVLRALEELKRGQIIQDFSIYNTTLEQVFINFSRQQHAPDTSLMTHSGWN